MDADLSRRKVLQVAGALALGHWASRAALAQGASPAGRAQDDRLREGNAAAQRALRLAHLTDSHVQPELRAGEGMTACLHHVQAQAKPDLIVTGGDLVMDAFAADAARTRLQWDLYLRLLKEECSVPIQHCLGNHDVWGWNKAKSGTTGSEPQYGKKWAMELLGLSRPYHAFDRGGWRFIVLDSVSSDGKDGYIGRLDDEQFEWLKNELARTPATTPVLIVSHIPILAACVYFGTKDEEKRGNWQVDDGIMHIDARRLVQLFAEHANVKLCLSGHIHQVDRVDLFGVTYICDGAVSGKWWRGRNVRTDEGYGVIDLYADGTFRHEYVPYGWNAQA